MCYFLKLNFLFLFFSPLCDGRTSREGMLYASLVLGRPLELLQTTFLPFLVVFWLEIIRYILAFI